MGKNEGEWKIEELKEEHFQPKWYLNGFPKSGLHWVALMMLPIAKPQLETHELWNLPWAGTFMQNSWTLDRVPLERVTYKIGRLMDGYFMKGHSEYTPELEQFLWYGGFCHVFIYRDFRDVAVSQAFHVLSDNDDLMSHPNKDLYKAMDSFEDVLKAVIMGVDEFPGVMERWEYYAPWLDVGWVYKLRFEQLKEDNQGVAKNLLGYGLRRVSNIYGLEPNVIDQSLETVSGWMVEAGNRTEYSPTFRKGNTGDWREYFTPEIEELFKKTDKNNWLERLGYG